MSEIVADLRDDLLDTLINCGMDADYAQVAADELLITIKRWCAKEPANDA